MSGIAVSGWGRLTVSREPAVRAWFDTPRNAELARELMRLGVRADTDLAEPAAVESLPLAGLTFVVGAKKSATARVIVKIVASYSESA